jgi:hypothetical protein
MRTDARRAYHVARTDFLARLRSRKLLVFLAVVVYVGYLINSGSFGVFYTVADGPSVNGALTAHLVGLNAGMAGSTVMLLAGFYVLRGTIERDEEHGHGPVLASSDTSGPVYLLGKLGSNVAVGALTAVVLAAAAVVNHAVHGVGPTDPVVIAWPVLVMVVPLTVLVGGVAVLFGTIDLLSGTLGRVAYFFGVTFLISGQILRPEVASPAAVPATVKAVDVVGLTLAYDLTFESIRAAVPGFDGGYASFGTGGSNARTFRFEGGPWPAWFFLQRLGAVVVGIAVTVAAATPFDRFRTTALGPLGRLRRRLSPAPVLARIRSAVPSRRAGRTDRKDGSGTRPPTVEEVSLPPVTGRDAGGFGRVLGVELRRILRGQPRWWYLGAALLVGVPTGIAATGGATGFARGLLPLVAVWPLFVWSRIGSQTARYGIRTQIVASTYPVGQLVAEWLAGCLVAAAVGAATFTLVVLNAGPTALVGVIGAVVFPPSLALVAGLWTGSPRLFEALYLGIWYVGPLNGGFVADFVGVTARGSSTGVPLAFAAVGVAAVIIAAQRRQVYRGVL